MLTIDAFRYFGVSLIFLSTKVAGVNFSVSNEKVLLGSSGRLTMTCDVTEVDVQTINFIRIQRIKSTTLHGAIADDWQTLAFMQMSVNKSPTLDPGITAGDKGYVADGSWDSTTPENSYLTLSMNIEKLVCYDARCYRCAVSYRSLSSQNFHVAKNVTISAYVKPHVTSLIARKNGSIVQGPSSTDVAVINVGDKLELTCTANIGSFQGTIIRWYKASETNSTNAFIDYQPPEGTYDEGIATNDNRCGYTRVAIIKYNVTFTSAFKPHYLAFECYVNVSGDPYGNSYTSENNPRFYAYVTDQGAGTSNFGAIYDGLIGGLVAIILNVVFVLFLVVGLKWFRHRRNGSDYPGNPERHQVEESRDTELNDSASKRQSHNDVNTACQPEVSSSEIQNSRRKI